MLRSQAGMKRYGCILAIFVAGGAPRAGLAQRPLGIDVSYWQGAAGISQTTWNNVAAAGRSFAFCRCTHYSVPGTESDAHGDPDPSCGNNVSRARTAGLLVGLYHFARPTVRDPITEANAFVNYATVYFGTNMIASTYLRPVLDLENGSSTSHVGATSLTDWANQWMNSVQAQTGVEPMIYTGHNYAVLLDASIASRTLWFANYVCAADPQTANPTASISPWSAWTFWQYCSSLSVGGISPVDTDVFNGTAAQLQHYVIGPPMIVLNPITLTRTIKLGASLASDTFTVGNDTSLWRTKLNYTIADNASWLSVTPLSGSSTGAANTHTINYATSGLASGHYTAIINVAATGASNTPRQLLFDLTVKAPGDYDGDGDADICDFGFLQACLAGSASVVTGDCLKADFNQDTHVDTNDVTIFINCAAGADVPVTPGCDTP